MTDVILALKALRVAVKYGVLAWKRVGCLPDILGQIVSPLALSDEDFMFLYSRFLAATASKYVPTTEEETQNCKSLCNSGVLRPSEGGYKLTWMNRHLVKKSQHS